MGDKLSNFCRDTNRSEKWLFTWVKRFKTGEEEWYRSQSNAPKKHGRKTRKDIESTIVNLRKALMVGNEHESKYLGVGADAIQYRMEKLGFSKDETHSVSTIICGLIKSHVLLLTSHLTIDSFQTMRYRIFLVFLMLSCSHIITKTGLFLVLFISQ
ncbi:MAG: hypothetical protein U9N61_04815 [Euryarchaeota archaeon]|nr:hypothetical protein [Euryarchaeota archaeon]